MKKFLTALTCVLLLSCASAEAQTSVAPVTLKKADGVEAVVPAVKDKEHPETAAKMSELLANMVKTRLNEYEVFAAADARNRKRYAFQASYKVKYNDNGLLSVVVAGYEYTGGAHGNSWQKSLTADLKTGKVYRLGDLFKSGSDYRKIIDERVAQEINRRGWRDGVQFPGVRDDTAFYLTEEALVIYYQPYEIAAYVFGLPSFTLDRYELNELLVDELQGKI